MYGLVNQAIADLVVAKFGTEAWSNICDRAGFKERSFVSHEPYDDSLTFEFIAIISDEHKIPVKDVLIAFGEYWVQETAAKKYGNLFLSSGNGLAEFLLYLPNFHSKVMMVFKDIEPPEFLVLQIDEATFEIHYSSVRSGLGYFVLGLIHGLAKFFGETIAIKANGLEESKNHYLFEVKIL